MIGKYKIIGVCLSRIQEEDRLNCIKPLNEYACAHGYRLLIFNAFEDLYLQNNITQIGEGAVFQLIQYEMLDALILFGETIKKQEIRDTIQENCRRYQVPLLCIDLYMKGAVNFSFDYANTFEALCRHVIKDHHAKRIFMMGGLQENRFSQERVQAFRKVMQEERLPVSEGDIAYGDFWDQPTLQALEEWFTVQKRDIPDAIVCANDTMAIVVSKYLQDRGCRVPEDCIVTGFDGIMESSYHIPHLTTCTQNYDEMGKRLIEAIERHAAGLPNPESTVIPFHIRYSQSCGCEKLELHHINNAMQEVLDHLQLSKQRQELMCQVQSAVTTMSSVSELPSILIDHFVFHTMVFAVNDDIFRSPNFGASHRGENAYSDSVNILYQRVFWNPSVPCVIPHKQLAPNLEQILERTDPVICCCIHFLDLILGYCILQPAISYDEYEKMHSFVDSIDSSLGIFHSQLHVKSINMQLKSANNELERLYIHDQLTGLLNRYGFYRQIAQQLEDCRGKDLRIVIISADLDGLKTINDTYGHTEGDNAIKTVGRALMASAIQGEVCARFGGDEFSVAGIISEQYSSYYESFRRRFRDYLHQYNQVSNKPYLVESSIGFCMEPYTEDISLDNLIKIADANMYQDKIARKKCAR